MYNPLKSIYRRFPHSLLRTSQNQSPGLHLHLAMPWLRLGTAMARPRASDSAGCPVLSSATRLSGSPPTPELRRGRSSSSNTAPNVCEMPEGAMPVNVQRIEQQLATQKQTVSSKPNLNRNVQRISSCCRPHPLPRQLAAEERCLAQVRPQPQGRRVRTTKLKKPHKQPITI